MSGIPGISTGGGDINADWGATATNTGGTNALGGFSFGNYNPAASTSAQQSWVPWVVGGVVVIGAVMLLKGGK